MVTAEGEGALPARASRAVDYRWWRVAGGESRLSTEAPSRASERERGEQFGIL